MSEAKLLTKEEIDSLRRIVEACPCFERENRLRLLATIADAWRVLGYTVPPQEGTNIPLPPHSLAREIMFRNRADEARTAEIAALKADVERLTRERDDVRQQAFRECADIAFALAQKPTIMTHRNGCHDVGVTIRRACPEAFKPPQPDRPEGTLETLKRERIKAFWECVGSARQVVEKYERLGRELIGGTDLMLRSLGASEVLKRLEYTARKEARDLPPEGTYYTGEKP